MRISVSMIALNEAAFISRALSSCAFADEVIVVDGGSTDETIEILDAHPKVTLVRNAWRGHFGHQRQVSLDHCTGDWIVRLDADEAFSWTFEAQIRALLDRTPLDIEAYRVRQCNLVGNAQYYSRSADQFESTPRIWRNRHEVHWEHAVHESLTGFSCRVLNWDAYVVHYGFLDKSRFLKKGRIYAQIPGSLVTRAEDLVFRDYDFQPIPEQARVAPHVPPFALKESGSSKPRVAMVRGPHLDPDEIRSYGLLQEFLDLTVYTTCRPNADRNPTDIPVVTLPDDPLVATAMSGLEYALFDADIIFVAQIIWPYAYQAIRVKEKFGHKVIALQTDTVPFANEENGALKQLKQYNRSRVDMFVAATDRAGSALMIEGVPQEKITVIPTGDDLEPGKARRLGLMAALNKL